MKKMKSPTRVEVATIAAVFVAYKDYSPSHAVIAARELIAAAAEHQKQVEPEKHKKSVDAAKALGYVSRNWRSQFKRFIVMVWPQIRHKEASAEDFFAHHEGRGWDQRTVKELTELHRSYLSQAARRPGKRQRISAKR